MFLSFLPVTLSVTGINKFVVVCDGAVSRFFNSVCILRQVVGYGLWRASMKGTVSLPTWIQWWMKKG